MKFDVVRQSDRRDGAAVDGDDADGEVNGWVKKVPRMIFVSIAKKNMTKYNSKIARSEVWSVI